MKIFSFSLFCLFNLFLGFSQEYNVKIKIHNPENYGLMLGYSANNTYVMNKDAIIEDGWTVFKGKVEEPVMATLYVRGNFASVIKTEGGVIPGPGLEFILSNDEISITGDADLIYMAKVTGGKANNEWASIKSKQDKLTHEGWVALKKAHDNYKPGNDSIVFVNAQKLRSDNAAKIDKLQGDFMKKNPHSLASMYFLANKVNSISFEELKAAYAQLASDHKTSAIAKLIAEKIESMEASAIGKPAIAINKKDVNGKPVNLETLKGKYVLLDFWGSWCGPCRASHPHLKKLYAKYKQEGFEILGIAQETGQTLEGNRKAWINAIEADGIPWLQVLNNEDIEKFDAVKAYGVTAFPTKILLDKEGRIMARYVGDGEEFDKKLYEIFGH